MSLAGGNERGKSDVVISARWKTCWTTHCSAEQKLTSRKISHLEILDMFVLKHAYLIITQEKQDCQCQV